MPELPEVQTTVSMLDRALTGARITGAWTDYGSAFHRGKDNIKDKKYFAFFKKTVVGRKILGARRRAKNVLIDVSGNKTIVVHMKMTGHLLVGRYRFAGGEWRAAAAGPLADPFNRFIHLALPLADGRTLVLSDMRKFATVSVWNTDKLSADSDLAALGPEPLETSFTYARFRERLGKRPAGPIKTVLMDQEVIAGIGNIYSDEVLWRAGIHPLSRTGKLPDAALRKLYAAIGAILRQSIRLGGDSLSDYRNPAGEKGGYQNIHKAYRQTGERCPMRGCRGVIKRIVVGGRSAHFCPMHQKRFA